MVTIHFRYENGQVVLLEPLPQLKEGDTYQAILIDFDEDSSFATMLASEEVLRRDWDTPEEDEAWAHL